MSNLKKIIIDGIEVEVDGAMTLLQAAEEVGIEIPRFCYHERLSIAGNCRMCLVEVVGGPPKPTASCAMQVRDLRPGPNGEAPVVKTNSPMVKKAREGVMEFLLINHPLDCPICDQGGECDLQDQAMAYGVDFSRYREPKRASENLNLGPLVATQMTRCISCTRCVRFTTEVAGITQMGQTGRGEDSEITSYLNQTLDSNLQGNIIDLCPVGALTSKPYAFTARPWELGKTESIDVMDALGSNIRVDTKGREVMRILPRNHDGVNEEWISDKTRFVWDGLRRQRLDTPYIREAGKLRKASWGEALKAVAAAMKGRKVAGLVGDLAPVEAAFSLKMLIEGMGGRVECRTDGARLPAGNRSAYVGNAAIEDIDNAKSILLVGCNPRDEAPVLNARIRKAWLQGAQVSVIGPAVDLTFDYNHAGTDRAALMSLVSEAERSGADGKPGLVIVGQGALAEADGEAVLAQAMKLAQTMGAKLLVLHTAAARVGAMDVGAVTEGGLSAAIEGAEVIYNLGADEVEIGAGPFVIYQGSHGDRGAHRADVILPAAAYTEENGLFVNTEGRPQLAFRAGFPPGEAKENWAILRALSAELGQTLPWDTMAGLRRKLVETVPHLGRIDQLTESEWQPLPLRDPATADFRLAVRDFYLTNPIARASQLMAELSAMASRRGQPSLAAE
ncbi:NADH-quinone oxidoreductase subunit G [Rhodobacter sphaeroides]|jgi:NADH-quinone oxidoreductase subunit G|uniref:NADH-quinone oxidoreductase n=1 Tax=Cereibacter sphaeroides (strain ATCC 17023 / DSM 158 / JCM 6121 / CCUG 31486 / LMG 2827 / NBRC 12203 / NCIMB 8253 / ATH 2.4.1.) TaxID=272943 RepID=Q3J3F3_CERS4|nr:NADH-quinone oxidoreductase subunit NuoG [Cereibacter sphaeroides]ABA78681.2 NADH dehydrogenase subunit G [Cereibacter sphaeroides 2.4.1]AMJ47020.1 NADH dehydrogenase [Cereibacter sphaeroides]ANS33734.1 NADH-quinone oxidoreductase subunit G [Cereibacter sphaeroides]ATN62777.1 NADH-quinone oxidoreductase subunit G [Cereibacter sphaeroides]AXC60894.1 NADH-quinone oxidoreductase subunit G [Cereibacter sphaeroides 2.4.1]